MITADFFMLSLSRTSLASCWSTRGLWSMIECFQTTYLCFFLSSLLLITNLLFFLCSLTSFSINCMKVMKSLKAVDNLSALELDSGLRFCTYEFIGSEFFVENMNSSVLFLWEIRLFLWSSDLYFVKRNVMILP